ncbi:coenzyme F420-0:L-glutamate ligase [Natronolimnohabitans sp. A-GB9]|uniref:coenzyme F420-0:L-glutamate ligase n=1 Tax=Natronolimnohabitans sp. A-GB9 TaxID=3069757 RepID=UPI0027AE89F9|nr:coenzyme F420-0:L-glutamate ligase [Natronolimnohabitans sp. A-GB9]MDQ2052407.1 coenzyme F420-0:L-glutamate ligase [Natronolimnohabitans sp. A-GB9]
MSEITYQGLDIGLLDGGEDLVGLILEATDDGTTIQDDDVLVVSSKVVSLAEERMVALERVPVSPRAERIADVTGIDPREVELILRESTVLGAIPVADIASDRLEASAADQTERPGQTGRTTPVSPPVILSEKSLKIIHRTYRRSTGTPVIVFPTR